MNRLSFLLPLVGIVLLPSCSQEEILPNRTHKASIPIKFQAGVTSRVDPILDYSVSSPATFYVTAFLNEHRTLDADTVVAPYFDQEMFNKLNDTDYVNSSPTTEWPNYQKAQKMEFFAYAPNLQEIKNAAYTQLDTTRSDYQTLKSNYTDQIKFVNSVLPNKLGSYDPVGSNTFDGVPIHPGYVLSRFYVATDISKQIDFITAHTTSDVPKDSDDEVRVPLMFKHQLSNIEIRAYSANPTYNIEVAGIRIGHAYTGNCLFNFCNENGDTHNDDGGEWFVSQNPQRLPVDYIYGVKDSIVRLGHFTKDNITVAAHTNASTATTLMGFGGNAMVIPTKNGKWKGVDNPWIATKYIDNPSKVADPWDADNEYGDMYFSVLVRVTVKKTGTQVYPYGNNTTMNVVTLAKELTSNNILGRVPRGSVPADGTEVLDFGWVCVPVSVDWKRGKKYIYTLDFTDGIGIQDPDDDIPGAPILGSGITFTMTLENWVEETVPDMDVPEGV